MSDPWNDGLARLEASSDRVADAIAGLTDDQWRAPSPLPGWSRAHVGAHIALNAEGFLRALSTHTLPEPLPVYDSGEAREADIEALSAATPAEVVHRLRRADDELVRELRGLSPELREGSVPRVPGGPTFAIRNLPTTRRRELEVHGIDLDAGLVRADWPEDFVIELLDRVTWDHYDDGPFSVYAGDLDRRWQVGEGEGPTVRGQGAELAWWLTDRPGADLVGELPMLSAWAPRPGP